MDARWSRTGLRQRHEHLALATQRRPFSAGDAINGRASHRTFRLVARRAAACRLARDFFQRHRAVQRIEGSPLTSLRAALTLQQNDAPDQTTQFNRHSAKSFSRRRGHMLSEFQKRKIANLFTVHDLDHDGALERSDYVEYTRRFAAKRGFGPGSPQYDELLSQLLGFWSVLEQIADRN